MIRHGRSVVKIKSCEFVPAGEGARFGSSVIVDLLAGLGLKHGCMVDEIRRELGPKLIKAQFEAFESEQAYRGRQCAQNTMTV